jgi:predicted TIM-barrel fold metal-dependent hydrolase
MPYVEGRLVHDADAHIMETPLWLRAHAESKFRDRLPTLSYASIGRSDLASSSPESDAERLEQSFVTLGERHASSEYRSVEDAEIMSRKNFDATGSFIAEDRPRALDLLGFSSQLIFNTFHNSRLYNLEHGDDLELAYAAARAHNRGILEFCSVDPRLLPALYVPLAEPAQSLFAVDEAISSGAAAILIASGCPARYSPSHLDLFPIWARIEEAGIPVVFHVGGTGELIDPNYFNNGLPIPHDFHGGDENFRSVDYMGIPGPPAQTLATMIFDGVFEAFPRLRIGVMEQGAIWVPSWTRQMEAAFEAFARHEDRLKALSMRPTEYVYRQMRFTPYPTEDVGWIIEQSSPEIVMFSSDFPHVEGGRRPVERFEATLGDATDEVRQRFYADNFLDLMGTAGASLAHA